MPSSGAPTSLWCLARSLPESDQVGPNQPEFARIFPPTRWLGRA
ncbi:hypothetical protein ACFPRL_28500 [Pseudoclavibacter helvolus]